MANEVKYIISASNTGAIQSIKQFSGEVQKSTKTMDAGFASLKKSIIGMVGAYATFATITKTISFAKDAFNFADDIVETADALNMTTKAYQELSAGAALAGVNQQKFDSAMRIFNTNLVDVKDGTGQLSKVFYQYGISLKTANGEFKTTDQLINDVANVLQKIQDPVEKARVGTAALGRDWAKMTQFLKDGAEGIKQWKEEAQKMGLVIDEGLLRQAAATNDKFDLLSQTIKIKLITALVELAPHIDKALDLLFRFFNIRTEDEKITDKIKEIQFALKGIEASDTWLNRFFGHKRDTKQEDTLKGELEDVQEIQRLRNAGRRYEKEWGGYSSYTTQGEIIKPKDIQKLEDDYKSMLDKMSTERLKVQATTLDQERQLEIKALEDNAEVEIRKFKEIGTARVQIQEELWKNIEAVNDKYRKKEIEDQIKFGLQQIEANPDPRELETSSMITGAIKAQENETKRYADNIKLIEDQWKDLGGEVQSSLNDAFKGLIKGTESFSDVVIKMLDRISDKMLDMVLNNFWKTLFPDTGGGGGLAEAFMKYGPMAIKFISGIFGGGYTPQFEVPASGMDIGYSAAKGGIFPGGFRKFQSGGIATQPTLGLVGEGGQNEAMVPLPDGKSIPVKMKGGGEQSVYNINISAMDSRSFMDFAKRNPQVFAEMISSQINKGNSSLISSLNKATR